MPKYTVIAKIDQIVTKEIKLVVAAGSEEEAQAKATTALGEYPDKVTEPSVLRMVTMKSNYWIPKSVEFVKTEEQKPSG